VPSDGRRPLPGEQRADHCGREEERPGICDAGAADETKFLEDSVSGVGVRRLGNYGDGHAWTVLPPVVGRVKCPRTKPAASQFVVGLVPAEIID
jgi:hypothetical protein